MMVRIAASALGFLVTQTMASQQPTGFTTCDECVEKGSSRHDKIYLFAGNFKYCWQEESLKLLVPSVPWNPSKNPIGSIGLIPWYKKFFDAVFVKQGKTETQKYIFISRSKAQYRRISNEVSLMEFLSKKGFVSFNLEDLSVYDQAALFNNAEIIIGPHGAGWANLIFCKPGTMIIEIDHGVKGTEQRSAYKTMAQCMGCSYHALYVDLLEETDSTEDIFAPINQDMTVDIAVFEKFYQELS
jgi:hypothetical protein